ncbi:hypothetical protein GCM10022206_75330 [Streptomyces chiangmaiensis]
MGLPWASVAPGGAIRPRSWDHIGPSGIFGFCTGIRFSSDTAESDEKELLDFRITPRQGGNLPLDRGTLSLHDPEITR